MRISKSNIEDTLLIAVLAFAPFALASVHTWAYCTIAMVSLVLFTLHFLNAPENLRAVLKLPISIGLMLFMTLILLYIIPLPNSIIKFLSPEAYNLRETYLLTPVASQPLSIYPRATINDLIKLISYSMIFFTIVSKITIRNYRGRNCEEQSDEAIPKKEAGKRTPSVKYVKEPENSLIHAVCVPRTYTTFILFGSFTSILSILFHSLCDFNMHIPANALYFMIFLSIVTAIGINDNIDVYFLRKLINSIIIIAFTIAVFGIIQKLSYNGKIYWLIKIPGNHFGPYVNYDHFAGFMEMCTFLAIANFISKISTSSVVHMKKLKDKIIWFSTKEANKTLIYLFFAVVMTTSLFLTTSRGGIMSFCASLVIFYSISLICAERKKRRRIIIATLTVVVLITVMALWIGPEETVNKFKILNKIVRFFIKEKAILSELRPYFWGDTINLIKDFPVFGTGPGTYYIIFQKYRTFASGWGFLRYAHNDYLQLTAEMGVLGGIFIIAFFIWYFKQFKRCFRRLKDLG